MQDLKDGAVDPLDVRKDIFRALSESDWEAFHLTFKAPKSPKFSKITLKPREKALFKSGIKSVEQIARWITISRDDTVAVPVNNQEFILVELEPSYNVREEINGLVGGSFRYQIRQGAGSTQLIGGALYFSILCKLLKSGEWIHIGNGMEYFIGSEFIGSTEIRNVPCFSSRIVGSEEVDGENGPLIRVTVEIKSILIATQTPEATCTSSKVLCLPKCSSFADLDTVRPVKEEDISSLQNYWLMCHGYMLRKEVIKHVANVIFSSGSYYYPLCMLLENITILPKKSPRFKLDVMKRLFRDIKRCSTISVVPSKAADHTVAPTFCSASKVYNFCILDHSTDPKEAEDNKDDEEVRETETNPLTQKSSHDDVLSQDIMNIIDAL